MVCRPIFNFKTYIMKTFKFTKIAREKSPQTLLCLKHKRVTANRYGFFSFLFSGALTLVAGFSNASLLNSGVKPFLQTQSVVFTENLGQVRDQNAQSRPDVLFSGSANGMVYHLRNNGISYQLYGDGANQGQIYRLDVNWHGINNQIKIETDASLPGYDNFYNTVTGVPALNVKTYKGVTYKNIYNNVDLHYYEKAGNLEYDFIVAPRADYKQIQLQVQGAKKISILENGSVLYKTPFGDVLEGAPLVFQNGKKLKAHWVLKNSILSFEISDYNPALPLLIDPLTRVWGTYYGGTGGQFAASLSLSCRTDASGNVYMAGNSDATNSIATTGSHQTNNGGGFDTYLIKFDNAGVRLWATYYGGSGTDQGGVCAVDASGNVYLLGDTWSTSSIATPGAHQTVHGGGSNDCYLVKFNSSGVRQWATYYGGSGAEGTGGIGVDASGNIVITGVTKSPNAMSTPGSHQASYGGVTDWDNFVAKFNGSGVRQWGTYYGDAGNDLNEDCSVDPAGNVYLSGVTASTISIATPGSHQPTYGGGTSDGFLVKFNAAGVRQWGTYYGGSLTDNAYACSVDLNNDVYITGQTASTSGISTAGSHQSNYGGGTSDAFLAKFNATGTRLWATYYGDAGADRGSSCFNDLAGNVLFAGQTNSSAGVTTIGAYQTVFGGGTSNDALFVKFNSTGTIIWGTYYGGSGGDFGTQCFVDNTTGKIYLTGSTSTNGGTSIATSGSHQSSYSGNNNGFLVQFTDCNSPNPPVNTTAATNLTLCSNNSATLSATATGAINWYNSLTSTTILNTGSSLTTPLLSSGTHTFYAAASNSCSSSGRTAITITVSPLITVNSGAICVGESFTMVPGGVSSFTFANGSAVVSPLANASFTVTGVDQTGCVGSAISSVTVNPLPNVSVNSGSICSGGIFTIQPTGANNYTISGITPYVSPPVSTTYTITGEDVNGCRATAISTVGINPSPTVTAATSKLIICRGESAKITAGGASTYSWSTGATGVSITVSPSVATTYTVIGISSNSCTNKSVITQSVSMCAGITEAGTGEVSLMVYPNPASGNLNITTFPVSEDSRLEIYNSLGQMILSERVNPAGNRVDLKHYADGIYIIKIFANDLMLSHKKIIKSSSH